MASTHRSFKEQTPFGACAMPCEARDSQKEPSGRQGPTTPHLPCNLRCPLRHPGAFHASNQRSADLLPPLVHPAGAERRVMESARIRAKYPDRVPVRVSACRDVHHLLQQMRCAARRCKTALPARQQAGPAVQLRFHTSRWACVEHLHSANCTHSLQVAPCFSGSGRHSHRHGWPAV